MALVGRTGAGKSTVAAVAAGLLAPERGSVTLDGVALTELPEAAVRRRITWVGQDPHEYPRRSAAARQQKSDFLKPGGLVTDVCHGPCHAGSWPGP